MVLKTFENRIYSLLLRKKLTSHSKVLYSTAYIFITHNYDAQNLARKSAHL
jgi:hypothetical protein